jgi:hypothetical protein
MVVSLALGTPDGYTYFVITLESAIELANGTCLMLKLMSANITCNDSDMDIGFPVHWNPPLQPSIRDGPCPKAALVWYFSLTLLELVSTSNPVLAPAVMERSIPIFMHMSTTLGDVLKSRTWNYRWMK